MNVETSPPSFLMNPGMMIDRLFSDRNSFVRNLCRCARCRYDRPLIMRRSMSALSCFNSLLTSLTNLNLLMVFLKLFCNAGRVGCRYSIGERSFTVKEKVGITPELIPNEKPRPKSGLVNLLVTNSYATSCKNAYHSL